MPLLLLFTEGHVSALDSSLHLHSSFLGEGRESFSLVVVLLLFSSQCLFILIYDKYS